MQPRHKLWLLLALIVVTLTAIFLFPPFGQQLSFHHFADDRSWYGIPNVVNVLSNIPFLFVSVFGLATVIRQPVPTAIRVVYIVLFVGVLLTGVGSAYYHWNPNNDTLVWDRIPMTIVFMALLSATISELISKKLGVQLLLPFLVVGIGSVLWWHYTETQGRGDLRLYMWVQFFPMLVLPLLLWLYYDKIQAPALRSLGWIVVWYVVAKVFEQMDQPIYMATGISGHTFKHLAAAVSTWYFVVLFKRKYTLSFIGENVSVRFYVVGK